MDLQEKLDAIENLIYSTNKRLKKNINKSNNHIDKLISDLTYEYDMASMVIVRLRNLNNNLTKFELKNEIR